jgi:short-subunit dehydrogenase
MKYPKSIIITGASSGLGAALAQSYAYNDITLGLIGRNKTRLEEVAQICRKQGAKVEIGLIDVRDHQILKEWIDDFDAKYEVDLVIANAGISAGSSGNDEHNKTFRDIFAINVDGVINTILPAISRMKSRRFGQVAIISSLAGIRGLPSCPAYSASKAAVRFLGEGLRGELQDYGIEVCVVCPGYIKTPMTDENKFYMPFLMSPQKAANKIIQGLYNNRSRIAFPLMLYIPLYLISCISVSLTDKFFAKLPKK